MAKPLYQSKDWLYVQYVTKQLSMRSVANLANCGSATIHRWLFRFNIPIRSRADCNEKRFGHLKFRDRDWLREQYVNNGLSTVQIASLCNCTDSTIYYWLLKFAIPIRSHSAAHKLAWQDPEFRAKMSRGRKRQWQNPSYREFQSQATTERNLANWQDPAYRACHTERMQALWQNPEYRKIMSSAVSERNRRMWQNLEYRKKMSQQAQELWRGKGNPNWAGGTSEPYYGPDWPEQRRKARERDGICQHCGKTAEENGRALAVHHRTPFRFFHYVREENDNYLQANALDNLVSYCMSCHRIVEGQINDLDFLPQFAQQLELPLQEAA